jgi:hypothetical protein
MDNTAEKIESSTESPNLALKVSQKGAVSLYGLRRLPITFYGEEWEVLFANADRIKAFLEENREKLSSKNSEEA